MEQRTSNRLHSNEDSTPKAKLEFVEPQLTIQGNLREMTSGIPIPWSQF